MYVKIFNFLKEREGKKKHFLIFFGLPKSRKFFTFTKCIISYITFCFFFVHPNRTLENQLENPPSNQLRLKASSSHHELENHLSRTVKKKCGASSMRNWRWKSWQMNPWQICKMVRKLSKWNLTTRKHSSIVSFEDWDESFQVNMLRVRIKRFKLLVSVIQH